MSKYKGSYYFIGLMLTICTVMVGMPCAVGEKAWEATWEPELGGPILEWYVLGPFPNPVLSVPDEEGAMRGGFNKDFLVSAGGEISAELNSDTEISYMLNESEGVAKTQLVTASAEGKINLEALYDGKEFALAYAYAEVNLEEPWEGIAFFGSDDWAKVWLNGALVHNHWGEALGRAWRAREDHFEISLDQGTNRILVKIDQNTGPWAFSLELLLKDQAEAIFAEEIHRDSIKNLQEAQIVPNPRWSFIFDPGPFPKLEWENPELVKQHLGATELVVRWFDADLNEVEKAEQPGRYAAYVEAIADDGRKIRRAMTFFAKDPTWQPWYEISGITVPYIPNDMVSREVWEEQNFSTGQAAGNMLMHMLFESPDGAMLLAGLYNQAPLGRTAGQLESANTFDQDYHLALKKKILGLPVHSGLTPPITSIDHEAPVLRPGSLNEAGFSDDMPEQLRKVCLEWASGGNEPFTALVARNGIVVFHEAFGLENRPVTLDTRFPLASLTKSFAGLLFGQFLDQGLIELDDPVGKYLPDFPVEGEKMVTLRQCLTHTTGLEGHGNWGALYNPWMENIIVNGLELLNPGNVMIYNGMGFDLAGRVMEYVDGRSIFRIMHEQFFIPLDMDAPTIIDLGYGVDCTVFDLAKVGQVMLNRGAYGNQRFMSPETFDMLLPQVYREMYPGLAEIDGEYGLGIAWMRTPRPVELDGDAENSGLATFEANLGDTEGNLKDRRYLLSENTIGHGAASSAVLRADLDNHIVVAVSRFSGGQDYDQYLTRFLQVVDDSIVRKTD